MTHSIKSTILPAKLQPDDRVRFVSPASPIPREGLKNGMRLIEDLGLVVEDGKYTYEVDDSIDYLAGKDEDRLADTLVDGRLSNTPSIPVSLKSKELVIYWPRSANPYTSIAGYSHQATYYLRSYISMSFKVSSIVCSSSETNIL